MLKAIFRSLLFQKIASKMLYVLMRFSFLTTKWKIVGQNHPDAYHENDQSFIVCLWHDRLMTAPCVWKWKKPLHVLASAHKDGRLIADIVSSFDMPAIYGSTGKRGAVAAARKIVEIIEAKGCVAIIPDGPTGPRHKVAAGILAISKITNTDILPFSCCVKRFYKFNSWDKFIFAFPFNRGILHWGNPIKVAEVSSMDEDQACEYIARKIDELSLLAFEELKKSV